MDKKTQINNDLMKLSLLALSQDMDIIPVPKGLIEDILEVLDDLGSVNIVRCKDCVFGTVYNNNTLVACKRGIWSHDPNWFCADGMIRKGDLIDN